MSRNLSQFGLLDVTTVDNMGNPDDNLDDAGDEDLEAELQQLVGGGGGGGGKAKAVRKKKEPDVDLDAMVASCMKDYDETEELSDSDLQDPGLLAELQTLTGGAGTPSSSTTQQHNSPTEQPSGEGGTLQTIQQRLSLYRQAETNCKSSGESRRARRFTRGIKTLLELEKAAKAGRHINEEEIPPMIALNLKKHEAPTPNTDVLSRISQRKEELKNAAFAAKAAGDKETVMHYLEAMKVCDTLAAEVEAGKIVNLEALPSLSSAPSITTASVQQSSRSPPERTISRDEPLQIPDNPEDIPPPDPSQYGAPPPPSTIMEALEQRHHKYKSEELKAKESNNGGKARRMRRICKYYENAMRFHRAGKPFNRDDLPDPPGFAPIPSTDAPAPSQQPSAGRPLAFDRSFSRDTPIEIPDNPEDIPPPDPSQFGAPPPPNSVMEALKQRHHKYKSEELEAKESGNGSKARRYGRICKQYETAIKLHGAGKPFARDDLPDPPGFGPIPTSDSPTPAKKRSAPSIPAVPSSAVSSVQDDQLSTLQKYQLMFKQAALEAKNNGDMDTAKEYLKQALGFNPMISACEVGQPVDMSVLPIPPQMQEKMKMDFQKLAPTDNDPNNDREEVFGKLEEDLTAQVKMLMTNRGHYKQQGDLESASKFEKMALNTKKDLDAVRLTLKRGGPVPKFHYEVEKISKVHSCPDLEENELELSILCGSNYVAKSAKACFCFPINRNPEDLNTFAKLEFPFPRDDHTFHSTEVVSGTNNPEYNQVFKLDINPNNKTFLRTIRTKSLTVEIWNKGGFLGSDTLLGTASVKLEVLESKCEVQDTYELYEGRRPVGGKLELKMRLRNPLEGKQLQTIEQKLLVLS